MFTRHLTQLAFVVALGLVGACSERRDELAMNQHELEERLLSPCCWRQSLADHESPAATALRAEIHERLVRRETAASIEDDLVRRYGPRIRAVPEDGDPRWIIGATAIGGSVLALLVIGRLVRRRHTPDVAPPSSAVELEDEYAERLDDELLAVD